MDDFPIVEHNGNDDLLYMEVPREGVERLKEMGWIEVGVISNKAPALMAKPWPSFGFLARKL